MDRIENRIKLEEMENYLNSLWNEIFEKLTIAKRLSKEIMIKKLTKRLIDEKNKKQGKIS